MKILVTTGGSGRAGSFEIRGHQLGAAIGATVEPQILSPRNFDICVIVKRATPTIVHRLHAYGSPVVYDVVDGWPQPFGNDWQYEQCMGWLADQIATVRPNGIIAATEAMARDCEQFGIPTLVLPHHSRPDQPVNPIRKDVLLVGYEGAIHYLGDWADWLDRECAKRGWRFVVNPTRLADLDIVVAHRNRNGYAAMNWKAGTKLSNAQGTGTPCVLNTEAGFKEIASGAELWADTKPEMRSALDKLTDHAARSSASRKLLAHGRLLSLEALASTYREWLSRLVQRRTEDSYGLRDYHVV